MGDEFKNEDEFYVKEELSTVLYCYGITVAQRVRKNSE
jgi:hypothetical protein